MITDTFQFQYLGDDRYEKSQEELVFFDLRLFRFVDLMQHSAPSSNFLSTMFPLYKDRTFFAQNVPFTCTCKLTLFQ